MTFDVHIGGDDDEFEEGKGEVYSFYTVLKSLTQFYSAFNLFQMKTDKQLF